MDSLWALILSGFASFLVVELYSWLPVFTDKLIRYNAARLPAEISSRWLQEWQADDRALPGSIFKFLYFTVDLVRARWAITYEFYAPQVEFRPLMELNIRILSLTYAIIKSLSTLPLMFLIGLFVKLDSPGPVFTRFKRIGQGGHPFTQLKFRTTVDGSYSSRQFTEIGRVLERTGLAQLPFILNVLKGDINLIGPIAFQPWFTEKNGLEKIPYFTTRYAVKPGFFSFAEICGTKEDTPRRTIRYDVFYIKKRNFWLDLRLIKRTLWNAHAKGTKRQWLQRTLPPLPEEAKRMRARVKTLVKTISERYMWYRWGQIITFIIIYSVTFTVCWIYAIATFGFFLGVGLGLVLSFSITVLVASIAAWLWPLIALTVIPVVEKLFLS